MNPTDDPEDHRLYPIILKMVLWDEPEQKVSRKLEVNGLTSEDGARLLKAARKERFNTIRKEYSPQIIGGFGLLLFGCALFYLTWFRLGIMSSKLFVIVGLLSVVGFGLFVRGIIGYAYAPRQRGSITEDFADDF